MGNLDRNSKFLALILRHQPEKGNIVLDKHGWATVEDLVRNAGFSAQNLDEIVRTDNKSRYEFNADKTKIRAVQGHSLKDVDVQLEKCIPPGELFHGTKEDVKMAIARKGLLPMNRQHVHLTDNLKTAQETADRRNGKSIILKIDSCQMAAKGYKFYKASNGVWLCYEVPPEFITEYTK